MKELTVRPEIQSFDTFADFAKEFALGKEDLILTNEYIYRPIMEKANLECGCIFQEKYGTGEPTDVMIDQILEEMGKANYKRVIAVGGGTIIDIAKVMVLEGAVSVDALFDKKELQKERELIIIPTTCGTGSEVTNLSIINRTRKGTKMGLGSPSMYANYAVLIPEFMNSLPYYVFATSSIDALIHSVESYLSPDCTPYTEIFSIAAIRMILTGYCHIADKGQDARFEESRNYLIASDFGGIAFGNAGCAAVHALSYALGAKYHVPHGESNYEFFTDVLYKYVEMKPDGKIVELDKLLKNVMTEAGFAGGKEGLTGIMLLERLLAVILKKKTMSSFGATQDDVEDFAKSAVENQQRLLKRNYVPFGYEEIREIYQKRLNG